MKHPDRRTEMMREYDEAFKTPEALIEAYNYGWGWFLENSITHPDMDLTAALRAIPYSIFDRSDEAEAWWRGFEDASITLERKLLAAVNQFLMEGAVLPEPEWLVQQTVEQAQRILRDE